MWDDDDSSDEDEESNESPPDGSRVMYTHTPHTYLFEGQQLQPTNATISTIEFDVNKVATLITKLRQAQTTSEAERYMDLLADINVFEDECPVKAFCEEGTWVIEKMELLACGHFICTDCLSGVRGSSGRTVCPVCRQPLVCLTSV